ncbi:MAG: hypothetical protein AAF664_10240 [Planctomycetota bacterium]
MFLIRHLIFTTAAVAITMAVSIYNLGFGLFCLSLLPTGSYLLRSKRGKPRRPISRMTAITACLVSLYLGSVGPFFGVIYYMRANGLDRPSIESLSSRIYAPIAWLPTDTIPSRLLTTYVISWEDSARTLTQHLNGTLEAQPEFSPPAPTRSAAN